MNRKIKIFILVGISNLCIIIFIIIYILSKPKEVDLSSFEQSDPLHYGYIQVDAYEQVDTVFKLDLNKSFIFSDGNVDSIVLYCDCMCYWITENRMDSILFITPCVKDEGYVSYILLYNDGKDKGYYYRHMAPDSTYHILDQILLPMAMRRLYYYSNDVKALDIEFIKDRIMEPVGSISMDFIMIPLKDNFYRCYTRPKDELSL